MTHALARLRVRARAGARARGWLTAGPFRIPCALGPVGIARLKREGDGATPAGWFALLWAYYRPSAVNIVSGGQGPDTSIPPARSVSIAGWMIVVSSAPTHPACPRAG